MVAETPIPDLSFPGGCPDCGQRTAPLPRPLPPVGDDFDWSAREFQGYRRFMLEELAAAWPERTRWTAADLEVVLVEALAAVLDQLSDMSDRVEAEAFLETARRPESVRRLLQFIGYDAVREQGYKVATEFDSDPLAIERARLEGPRSVHRQKRMVTLDDYAIRLEEHPLVKRAHATSAWTGSWQTVFVTIVGWGDTLLDEKPPITGWEKGTPEIVDATTRFHEKLGLYCPAITEGKTPTLRALLQPYVEAYRMAGQEVVLRDAIFVGISLSLSVRVSVDYFQSEIRRAVAQALGSGPGGFFEYGRLRFGEDVYASDIIQQLMRLDGIEHVCLNRLRRVDRPFEECIEQGHIVFDGIEIAVCDNDTGNSGNGYYSLFLHGGRKG